MYEDDPEYQAYFNLISALYHNHPVRSDIAGTIESIDKITKDDLYLCYHTFYHPQNMILFLVGDINSEEVLDIIKQNQAKKSFHEWPGVKRILAEEPDDINHLIIDRKMDVSQPIFRFGFKERFFPSSPRSLVKQEIATDLLFEIMLGKGSVLYHKLYEDALIDDDFFTGITTGDSFGFVSIGGKTPAPTKLYSRLKEGLRREGYLEINEENTQRIVKKYIGDYIESFNSFDYLSNQFINYYLRGINYLEILEIIKEINVKYLEKRYHEIVDENNLVYSLVSN